MRFYISIIITVIRWSPVPCADKKASFIGEIGVAYQPIGWGIETNRYFPTIPTLWFKDNNGIKRSHRYMINRVPHAKHDDLSIRRKNRPRLLVLIVSGFKGKAPDFFHLVVDEHKRSEQDGAFFTPCAFFEENVVL